MLYPRYVQVSLDAPERWFDPRSGMWFRQSDGIIELPKGLDGTNIVLYLRRNILVDMTSVMVSKEDSAESVVKPLATATPNQLLSDSPTSRSDAHLTDEAFERLQETLTPRIQEETKEKGDWKETCEFCGTECSPKGINTHRKYCKSNPANSKK